METNPWSIKQTYQQAWELTKTNKKLWILGLAVSILAATSSGSGSSKNNSPSSPSNPTTSASLDTFGDRFRGSIAPNLQSIPPITYVALGAQMLALITVGSIIAMVGSAWSRAALIIGCNQVPSETNLTTISKASMACIKTFLAIDYGPWLKPLLLLLAASLVGLAGAVTGFNILLPLALLIGIITLIVFAFRIVVAQVWAYRFAAITPTSYQESMKRGESLAKGNIGKMVKLALINGLIIGVITLVLSLIPFAIFTPLMVGFGAVAAVFSYFTWHLTFNHLKETV